MNDLVNAINDLIKLNQEIAEAIVALHHKVDNMGSIDGLTEFLRNKALGLFD